LVVVEKSSLCLRVLRAIEEVGSNRTPGAAMVPSLNRTSDQLETACVAKGNPLIFRAKLLLNRWHHSLIAGHSDVPHYRWSIL
jgi:hypothetical protein